MAPTNAQTLDSPTVPTQKGLDPVSMRADSAPQASTSASNLSNTIRLGAQAERSFPILTTHKVKPGETLGGISQKYYRDSSLWQKILDANPEITPKKIKPGTILTIPQLSDNNQIPNYPIPEHPRATPGQYKVQSGDNLGRIALHIYNDARKWKIIAEANSLNEKDRLKVGQILRIPSLTDPKPISGCPLPNPKENYEIYTIRSGDNLRKIARSVYGDSELAKIIQEDNPGITNTNLKIGQKLRIRQGKVAQDAESTTKPEDALPSDARITQTIGERVVAFLTPEARKALQAKLKMLGNHTEQYALVEMANAAHVDLTPEGVKAFQKSQGLEQTGAIDKATAAAITREITATWYKNLVLSENAKYQWDERPGHVNAIGLRGFDLRSGRNSNEILKWNDTIAFVGKDKEGRNQVWEFEATTEPGISFVKKYDARTDSNCDGKVDVATLIPGQYDYYPGEHKAKEHPRMKKYALVPNKPLPVYRDTNHDFKISAEEAQASLARSDVGYGVNVHWGGLTQSTERMSAGCQVIRLGFKEFLKKVTPIWHDQKHIFYTLIDLSIEPKVSQESFAAQKQR